jgi:hypothetical protein
MQLAAAEAVPAEKTKSAAAAAAPARRRRRSEAEMPFSRFFMSIPFFVCGSVDGLPSVSNISYM